MPSLETSRLVVRPLNMADLNEVTYILDHESERSGSEKARSARSVWLQWTVLNYDALANLQQPPYGDRAVVLKGRDEVIGICGLAPALLPFKQLPSFGGATAIGAPVYNTLETGLFWTVAPTYRAQGYAAEAAHALVTYAFESLRLSRIVATTTFNNQASIGVMRKLGMQVEHNPHPEPHHLQVVGWLDNSSDAYI